MLNEFSKKEAPIQGLAGMGGGVPSRLLTLASGEITYVDDVFSTFLYTGAGSAQTITNGIDLAGEGGLVWTKRRNNIRSNILFDSERGTASRLISDSSNTPTDQPYSITMNSNGYSWSASDNDVTTGGNFCSWTFRKCPGFFDIVTYTGNGSAGHTVAHNLGSVPGCIFIRRLDTSKNWIVYHRGLDSTAPEDYYIVLNDTSTRVDNSIAFNDTAPTDTEFTLGTYSHVNADGGSYIAYLFAHNDGSFGEDSDEAVIKCGSYTGSSSAVTVNLGFEPQYVLVKNTSTSSNFSNWAIFDNMRGITMGADVILAANTSDPEGDTYLYSGSDLMNLSPTGFVADPPGSQSTVINSDGDNFIYIAIRRPHKPPESATEVFAMDVNTTSEPEYVSNFVVDWAFHRNISFTDNFESYARLLGTNKLELNTTSGESANSAAKFDFMDGWGDNLANDTNYRSWMFRRAPGFFDVVNYSGTGSTQNINHNLTVIPELLIQKRRTSGGGWNVYSGSLGTSKYLKLEDSDAELNAFTTWGNTTPTSSVFTIGGSSSAVNKVGNEYIVYLFATLSGISKVGTYSGSSSDVQVDCGFTAGARFVLIKRTNGSGEWFLYDSDRGLTTNSDPYLRVNNTAAQGTESENWVESHSSGFKVNSTAPSDLNGSGNTYLFLAIA